MLSLHGMGSMMSLMGAGIWKMHKFDKEVSTAIFLSLLSSRVGSFDLFFEWPGSFELTDMQRVMNELVRICADKSMR